MALVLANRVQETTTTTGTGTITLDGAVSGYQSFAAIGNANTTYYTITSGTAWEVGIGTYTSAGTTLARTTILSSSAAGAAITLSGTSNVFADYPAERAVAFDSGGNQNLTLNNIDYGYTTIVTSAGTTTLTVASPYYIYFTGTLSQTVVMPVTNTLALGWSYHIANNSNSALLLNSSGGNTIATLPIGVTAHITCIGTTLTTAADWDYGYTDFTGSTGSGSVVLAASPSFTGTVNAQSLSVSTSFATSGVSTVNLLGTGAINIGATTATNAVTVGQSTGAQTLNLATGATLTATTKAVNIGTNGVSGSTTTITIGAATGTTTTINGTLNYTSAVGSTSETVPLISGGTGAASNLTIQSTSGAGTTDYIAFRTASQSERMRIDASGNVGIGTSSPGALLQLNKASGAADLRFSVGGTLYSNIYASSSDVNILSITAIPLIFGTDNTERFRILSTGGITSSALADAVGYKGLPQNSQTASYTLALTDMGKMINTTTGGVVIPANASVAFPIGSAVSIFNNSGSSQTISITTDTLRLAGTATTGSRTLAQYGVATCLKVTSTVWVISGAGVT